MRVFYYGAPHEDQVLAGSTKDLENKLLGESSQKKCVEEEESSVKTTNSRPHVCGLEFVQCLGWWREAESNRRPVGYESTALTN